MMKKLSILAMAVLLLAGSITITGCHTTRGFGQDVEKAGEALQDSTH